MHWLWIVGIVFYLCVTATVFTFIWRSEFAEEELVWYWRVVAVIGVFVFSLLWLAIFLIDGAHLFYEDFVQGKWVRV